LEGYYNNNIFHRVVPNFIAQTGDATGTFDQFTSFFKIIGTGEGGESIYGKPFEDEFHSRLKFVHRGIIATVSI
jgi:peptidyl-prolyl cis-trans isomerase SDCCAG10